jgi:hypothetical protein
MHILKFYAFDKTIAFHILVTRLKMFSETLTDNIYEAGIVAGKLSRP